MAAMLSVIDTVSSVLSVFIQDSGSEDLSNLDMILMSLMSSYSEVGLLDEISVTIQRQVEEDVLTNLWHLHTCLNQLCLEYETKVFTRISTYPGRSSPVSIVTHKCPEEGPRRS